MTNQTLTLADIHPDALYDAATVARVLGLCLDTVYRLGRAGTLRASRIGPKRGRTLFKGRVILQYAEPMDEAA